MASKRLLKDSIVLSNYVGEIDDIATYQDTYIFNCYCPAAEGIGINKQGREANDSIMLYIFDRNSRAVGDDGIERTFISYDKWKELPDKSAHWTLCDNGRDYVHKIGTDAEFLITGYSHKVAGSKRMWHFEVNGK